MKLDGSVTSNQNVDFWGGGGTQGTYTILSNGHFQLDVNNNHTNIIEYVISMEVYNSTNLLTFTNVKDTSFIFQEHL